MKIRARLMVLILFAGIATVMLFLFSLQPLNGIYTAISESDGVSRYDLRKLIEGIKADEPDTNNVKQAVWERAAERAEKLHPGTQGLIFQVIRPDGIVASTIAPRDDPAVLRTAGLRSDRYSFEDLARLYENRDYGDSFASIVQFVPFSNGTIAGSGGILGIVMEELASGINLSVSGRSGMIFILLLCSGIVSAVIASFVVILFGTGPVLRRFRDLNRGIEAVMAGNLSVRLNDRGGDEIAFVGRSFDTMIERLAEQKKSREKAEEEKRYVVASLSHDLRTPLSSIMGYAESLRDVPEQSPDEILEQADIICGKSAYMKRLLDELLDFAATGSPTLVLNLERFDLLEFLRTLLIGFLPRIRERRVELDAGIPDGRHRILADRTLLTRAFENIVSNALSYGDVGGMLTVTVERETSNADPTREPGNGDTNGTAGPDHIGKQEDFSRGMVGVLIINSGTPVPEEDRERIFDGFYRADASRHGEGLGLGLTISRNIIRKHGGELSLEKSDGEETIFRVMLPTDCGG